MNYFNYKAGTLYVEDTAIHDIAAAYGTPFYCYSLTTAAHHFTVLQNALTDVGFDDALICYSVKANSNLALMHHLQKLGTGADIVSEGELRRALHVGIAPEKIVYSGVGKTAYEIDAALAANIAQFNVESLSELDMIATRARALNKVAPVALRVNPDIDAVTHEKITTGKAENKFGIAWEDALPAFEKASQLAEINLIGIDIHIGSQITDLAPFHAAFIKVSELLAVLQGKNIPIQTLDLGGGLGVPYDINNQPPPDPLAYARLIKETLGNTGCRIIVEPGRVIVGNAGILVSSVIRTKYGKEKNFMIIDAAMTDLIRPSLYDAYHHIAPVDESTQSHDIWDIVGPVCESGDFLGKNRTLPLLHQGDLLAIFTTGAYGAVQASHYNSRALAPEIVVRGDTFWLARKRIESNDMLAYESIPDW